MCDTQPVGKLSLALNGQRQADYAFVDRLFRSPDSIAVDMYRYFSRRLQIIQRRGQDGLRLAKGEPAAAQRDVMPQTASDKLIDSLIRPGEREFMYPLCMMSGSCRSRFPFVHWRKAKGSSLRKGRHRRGEAIGGSRET